MSCKVISLFRFKCRGKWSIKVNLPSCGSIKNLIMSKQSGAAIPGQAQDELETIFYKMPLIAGNQMKDLPKFLPTMQCHVGLYFLSNSFLMYAAMSFSTLYFSNACKSNDGKSMRELVGLF